MRTSVAALYLPATVVLMTLFAVPAVAEVKRLSFSSGDSYVMVEVKRDDLVHFETGRLPQPSPDRIWESPMIVSQPWAGPLVFDVEGSGFRTSELAVEVDSASLCVRVQDIRRQFEIGNFCPRQLDQPWKYVTFESAVTTEGYGLGQYFHEPADPDGNWIGRVWDPLHDSMGNMLRGFEGGANNFSMFPIFYGLGEGSQNYGLFFDHVYKQMWDFRARPFTIGGWGDQLRWMVFTGDDLPELRRKYMQLTGRPPVPPRRAFGLWVSEFGYSNWSEIDQELATLKESGFPVDGFAMDLQWFGGTFGDPLNSRMGSLTWDERNFPDPGGKIRDFKAQHGVHLMLIEEPFISDILTEHRELASRGHLARDCEGCGPTRLVHNPWWGYGGMVDFTSAAASDFWHDFRRQRLYNLGIRDHWLDLGEPEQYNAWAWYAGFPELNKHGHPDIHNIYNFRWAEGIRRGYERNGNMDRLFILSRSGTSGIQRFGASLWSGDVGTNWPNVRAQMYTQTHMAFSGVDYYGSDIGGFQRSRSYVDGGTESLYTQWFAYSSLFEVPVRPHAWNLDKQRSTSPAKRGDTASNLANIKKRYELLPYYYSLAYNAWLEGDALFPPAFYFDQTDQGLRGKGHLKMIGRNLVAAVDAGHQKTAIDVRLPRGGWYHFDSGEYFDATKKSDINGFPLRIDGLFKFPLFARAGAIVPVQQAQVGGTLSHSSELRLKVFAGTNSDFTLFEDDGVTTQQEQGVYARTEIKQETTARSVTVIVAPTVGSFQGLASVRSVHIEIVRAGMRAVSVKINGNELRLCTSDVLGRCFVQEAGGRVVVHAGEHSIRSALRVQVDYEEGETREPWAQIACANGVTTPGTSVYVVGSDEKLGAWDPQKAVLLSPSSYPVWSATLRGLEPGKVYEWKCLKRHEATGQVSEWEGGVNHSFTANSGFSGTHTGAF